MRMRRVCVGDVSPPVLCSHARTPLSLTEQWGRLRNVGNPDLVPNHRQETAM